MKKISNITLAEATSILAQVEQALRQPAVKPTATEVLRSLAGQGVCSPKSRGTEKSFLAHCQKLGLRLPDNLQFAVRVPAPAVRAEVQVPLRAVSRVEVLNGAAVAVFPDGKRRALGTFDEARLRSNCTLTEFSV